MSKNITIQFTVTTPYQVFYEVNDDFSLNTTNVHSAIKEISNFLDRDIFKDFDKEEDREKEDGYDVIERVGIDFIEIKNSDDEIVSLIEED